MTLPGAGADAAPVGIGEVIASYRTQRGWSWAELGRRANLHQSNVKRIEQGKIDPTGDTLKRLAQALGVPVTDLRREAGLVDDLEEQRSRQRPAFAAYIDDDPFLTERQKRTLKEIYVDMVRGRVAAASVSSTKREATE